MFIFTLKKMLRNKWMVLCLLIGSIVFVTVFSGIPTYTNGVFRHMLIRDLEGQQVREGRYPGNYFITLTKRNVFMEPEETHHMFRYYDYRITNFYTQEIGLPVLASRRQYTLNNFFISPRVGHSGTSVTVTTLENFENHIELVSGRLPQSDPAQEIIEFVMILHQYQNSDIRLDEPFDIFSNVITNEDNHYGRAMCVGVFRTNDSDPYWYSNPAAAPYVFVTDFDYLVGRYVETESDTVRVVSFFYALDFSDMKTEDVGPIMDAILRQRTELGGNGNVVFFMERTLTQYLERIEYLGFMLQVLNIPVILMLIFYIYMVSRLMVHHESNEIAVLRSRGTRNVQILSIYALESVLIAGAAVLIGPPLSLILCRILGLSNGFMELVSRKGIVFELSPVSYFYAALAAGGFILVMLAPIPRALKDTIVKSKQKKSRFQGAPLWQKLFLDVLLIAASLYSIRIYSTNVYIQSFTNSSGVDAPIDPMLLIASALFILGAGLLFLRIFPLITALFYHIFKRVLSPTLYSSLLSIVRTGTSSRFLALFLIFSIGLGLFYSTTARTINRFLDDRIRYDHGADIILSENWPTRNTHFTMSIGPDGNIVYTQVYLDERAPGPPPDGAIMTITEVREPPFERILDLEGVKDATKVFNRQGVRVSLRGRNVTTDLIGVIPHEFGRVAWFRNDLLPYKFNEYLNIMTSDPSAIFLSSGLKEFGFEVGDHVRIGWPTQSNMLDGTIYGFVDFWPSLNPIPRVTGNQTRSSNANQQRQGQFVVANLNTIHKQMRIEPYTIWIKMEDGATSAALYESINESDIHLQWLRDTSQRLITSKNDPLLQGMNGTLTLGFIVILVITFIGFLVYWILSVRSRLLLFGIFRAMGLTKYKITSMLLWEQLFISGGAIAAGFGIGILASRLFVPMFQIIYTPHELVPPFLITFDRSDYNAIYIALGAMIITGLLVLAVIIKRLKVDQILKLGED